MLPYVDAMRKNFAAVIQTDIQSINIKATTSEKLGFTGREEGIACHASVLLSPVSC